MTVHAVAEWQTFAFSLLGAAAALVGLIFVAISINLDEILAFPWLVSRAGDAIGLLVNVVFGMGVLLIPGQSKGLIGAELLVIGLVAPAAFVLRYVRKRAAIASDYRPAMDLQVAGSSLSSGMFALAGLTFWIGAGGGLNWVAPAALISLALSIVNAWVLLIEVKR